jgi:hypothetical protein
MASNERWRQPLRVWKRYFQEWLSAPVEAALHDAANLFDFRPLHGALPLGAELKAHLTSLLPGQSLFLKAVADLTTAYRPPLGFFGGLVVAKGATTRARWTQKDRLTPLVNLVRLFSLERRLKPPRWSASPPQGLHPSVRAVGETWPGLRVLLPAPHAAPGGADRRSSANRQLVSETPEPLRAEARQGGCGSRSSWTGSRAVRP